MISSNWLWRSAVGGSASLSPVQKFGATSPSHSLANCSTQLLHPTAPHPTTPHPTTSSDCSSPNCSTPITGSPSVRLTTGFAVLSPGFSRLLLGSRRLAHLRFASRRASPSSTSTKLSHLFYHKLCYLSRNSCP